MAFCRSVLLEANQIWSYLAWFFSFTEAELRSEWCRFWGLVSLDSDRGKVSIKWSAGFEWNLKKNRYENCSLFSKLQIARSASVLLFGGLCKCLQAFIEVNDKTLGDFLLLLFSFWNGEQVTRSLNKCGPGWLICGDQSQSWRRLISVWCDTVTGNLIFTIFIFS